MKTPLSCITDECTTSMGDLWYMKGCVTSTVTVVIIVILVMGFFLQLQDSTWSISYAHFLFSVDQQASSPAAVAAEQAQNATPRAQQSKTRRNVLFIIADDLRPELGAYDGDWAPSPVHPAMHTPNIDELARRSTVFTKAYVQFPLCGPSRASFLTSRRPDTLEQYSFESFRATGGKNVVTLPQYFKENGYKAIGVGKIFDPPVDGRARIDEAKYSFSEPWYGGSNYHYWTHEVLDSSWVAVDPDTERRRPLPDNQVLNHALDRLRAVAGPAKSGEQPFFLAVGFYKPHCPYIFPEKYLQYYPESSIQLPPNPYVPSHFPEEAWHNYRNLRRFKDMFGFPATYNQTLSNNKTLALRRAYYASVTYIDDLVGQLLSEVALQGLADNTIVCFLGDHGYHLGENGEWTKQTSLELSARAPLMLHVPGVTDKGSYRKEFVEFVDIFPSLTEAADLPEVPLCPQNGSVKVKVCTEGTSFMPVVAGNVESWKERTFTMQTRYKHNVIGRSMRTQKYRYTEWATLALHTKTVAAELYDHEADPWENKNIADEPKLEAIRKELSGQLHSYWRSALPK